jgi:hypothetical protein
MNMPLIYLTPYNFQEWGLRPTKGTFSTWQILIEGIHGLELK